MKCSDEEMMSYLKDVGVEPDLSLEIDVESFLSSLARKYGTCSEPVLKACNAFDMEMDETGEIYDSWDSPL